MCKFGTSRFFVLPVIVAAAFIGGCDARQERAREAFGEYQAAVANDDLPAARRALGKLVTAEDSNPEYWVELGKVNLQLGDIGGAYDALTRAHELDQANVEVLGILSQLALRSGNLALAEEHVKALELLSPDNPSVRLTNGYVALRRGNFEEADRQAKLLIEAAPYDSTGKILQSRILLEKGKTEEAIALLREQVGIQPSDQGSLRALHGIYELLDRWPEAAWAASETLRWAPADRMMQVKLIEASLRAGKASEALSTTLGALAEADPLAIDALLAPWLAAGQEQREGLVSGVLQVGRRAESDRRLAFARFLAQVGSWPLVMELTQGMAQRPVAPTNATANALYGTALVQTGRRPEGLARLDEVIALDGANADALRGRATARMQARDFSGAVVDTQKLIAANRTAPSSWLLLAAIHRSAGQTHDVRRVLWEAFHELPSDHVIYQALSDFVMEHDGKEASLRLAQEFRDQRSNQMTRSFV